MAASAQDEPEYKMEIGAGVGLVSYVGDYNSNPLKGMQPWLALVAKYRLDPRLAIAFDLGTGKLKGKAGTITNGYEFSHNVTEADVRLEYNFWPYGTGKDYRGARRLTPFIFIGIGATYADVNGGSVVAANLPVGGGVKYKVATRLNIGLEWAMHFCHSDKLDGVEDPYHIKSSGIFKNSDGYAALQLTLTYSFLPKCKTCNKDNDD